ncbi:MAG: 50S ribosomal protein L11 methyltransferase, partial [Anaeroplasmataceae bacterium]|nr:50S ribosomal protein L11 methyltransferase [Anaeroplasmataceae bacterium]
LEAAIENFKLDFKNKKVLDIGASTGGFTDCALKHGAQLVYAVDVGTNQLDSTLKNRKDVISLEQTNILEIDSFPVTFDYIVMDVSFVSIEKILPAIHRFLGEETTFVCLIKPQFEVGKRYIKNGVVKDRNLHIQVLEQVRTALEGYQMGISKLICSPILGGSGNKEFLACIKRNVKTRVNIIEVCK